MLKTPQQIDEEFDYKFGWFKDDPSRWVREIHVDMVKSFIHAIRESDALAVEAKTRLDIVDDIFTMVMKTRDLKEIDVLEKVQKVVLEGLGVTQK